MVSGLVGVDGSSSSLAVVEVAARSRGVGQRVVHAFVRSAMHVPLGPSPLGPPEGGPRNMVDRLVAEADERAQAVAPEVDVSHVVVTGEPLTVLEAQSRAAELVVVGSPCTPRRPGPYAPGARPGARRRGPAVGRRRSE